MIKRVFAIVLALVAITWLGPASLAANADDSYVAPARVSVTPAVIEPGGRSTIEFSPGFFSGDESVEADVSGVHAGDARVVAPDGSTGLVSRSDGGMTAVFIAPEKGAGQYAVTFSASHDYVAIITVRGGGQAAHVPHPPPPPGAGEGTAADAALGQPGAAQESSETGDESGAPPDREGRVEIPGSRPEAPEWPGLEEIPWSIVLLAAIALVVTTVTVTLVVAARRRG